MRLRALAVAVATVTALLGPTAAADAHPSQSAITKAKAAKLAKAGVLKKTDLKRFHAAVAQVDPTDDQVEAAVYKCVGGTPPKHVAENPGFEFTRGPSEIDSTAAVIDTVKHAKADLKLIKTRRAAACYRYQLITAYKAQGLDVQKATVTLIKMSLDGADGAFTWAYDVKASYNGTPIRTRGYDVNALIGQTEIVISSYRFDGKLPNLDQATSLAELVASRVRAV